MKQIEQKEIHNLHFKLLTLNHMQFQIQLPILKSPKGSYYKKNHLETYFDLDKSWDWDPFSNDTLNWNIFPKNRNLLKELHPNITDWILATFLEAKEIILHNTTNFKIRPEHAQYLELGSLELIRK